MNKFKIIIASIFLVMAFSCKKENKGVTGIWVNDSPGKTIDTMVVKLIKDNRYSLEIKAWTKGKKRVRKVAAELKNNELILSNKSVIKYSENDELLIGKKKLVRVE